MRLSRHYYVADLKTWKWNQETNSIDEYYEEVEKDFTSKELKNSLKEDKWAIFGYTVLGAICGSIGFIGNWIFGLSFAIGVAILGYFCGLLQYYINHYKSPYRYYLGYQDGSMEYSELKYVFLEEIAERHENKLAEEKLAEKWRKKHPLEEKIRLALTQNPNYIADLLRYCELVKPNKTTEKQRIKREEKQKEIDLANQAIKVKYLGDEI